MMLIEQKTFQFFSATLDGTLHLLARVFSHTDTADFRRSQRHGTVPRSCSRIETISKSCSHRTIETCIDQYQRECHTSGYQAIRLFGSQVERVPPWALA
ncbi:hypothetical protein NEOLEDRAFT_403342 [Neolentinus lepideus HHB14362 ss-1]|uniref:Uncharacterized protein n=1 Tax=Neolentinus lepideus HHB14362 ss-1 TaxID=1314782 RepID=A0A165S3A4_9AGAM|nr:hypothetical protein NEOLEDRAFT_403342 [Neolentinus lepideus HHB14362 ss-1]